MFDEQPDGDLHGECAAEIHRLRDALETVVRQCGERLTKASGNTALLPHLRALLGEISQEAKLASTPIRNREADRQRFPDPEFNRWLDEGITDAGHTVWDQTGSVADAWAGWSNRIWYTDFPPGPDPSEQACAKCGGRADTSWCCGHEDCPANDALGVSASHGETFSRKTPMERA